MQKIGMDAFRRWDRERVGEIDMQQLKGLLGWLGFAFDPVALQELFKTVDADGGGKLNSREFLICMRNFRASQVSLVQRVIATTDTVGNGTLSGKEVLEAFSALGYIVSEQR